MNKELRKERDKHAAKEAELLARLTKKNIVYSPMTILLKTEENENDNT